jgi:formyltetrahydrofolate deformylase
VSGEAFAIALSCPRRAGIVAAASTHLFERRCIILDAQPFDDQNTGRMWRTASSSRAAKTVVFG